MRLLTIKEYFLFRLQYKNEQLAINEFHEFCDHVKDYNLKYIDILIYRREFAVARYLKTTITEQYRYFYDTLRKGKGRTELNPTTFMGVKLPLSEVKK